MGHRTLKRVPLDFNWPMDKVWHGYLCPYRSVTCAVCDGSGYNPETKRISDDWYDHDGFGTRWRYNYGVGEDGRPAEGPPWQIIGLSRSWLHSLTQDEVDALVGAGRLYDFTHEWKPGEGWLPKEPPYHPAAAEVNEWSKRGMGHDTINQWVCVEARARRLGVWGRCATCGGDGELWDSPEVQALSEAWEKREPPEGEGWQLWETVSEGSPSSPVCPTAEALADWCAENATVFADMRWTRDEWLKMFQAGAEEVEVGSLIVMERRVEPATPKGGPS